MVDLGGRDPRLGGREVDLGGSPPSFLDAFHGDFGWAGRFVTPPPGPLLEEGVDPKKGVFWRLVWGVRFGGRFGDQNEVSNGFW